MNGKKDIGQVIAIGGGGFGRDPKHLKIEKYIIKQSNKECPNICFIPTATGEDLSYIKNFNLAFHQFKCNTSVLSFFSRTPNLEELISEQDIIYVGGGNTVSMLAVWEEWGLSDFLRTAYDNGKILCGVSAGAICWFTKGITDSWSDELKVMNCLDIINTNACPHYNGEEDRRPSVINFLTNDEIDSCICIDDGAAVHYIDGKFFQTISFDRGGAYNVYLDDGVLVEDELKSIII